MESNDNKVVFVCPTKSLVNQTYLQIISNPKYNGEGNLAGIFTAENRIDEISCRILVTVPSCLEILLLAPTAARFWR
jgi:replicative superfamily II helicase